VFQPDLIQAKTWASALTWGLETRAGKAGRFTYVDLPLCLQAMTCSLLSSVEFCAGRKACLLASQSTGHDSTHTWQPLMHFPSSMTTGTSKTFVVCRFGAMRTSCAAAASDSNLSFPATMGLDTVSMFIFRQVDSQTVVRA
jgi:hypothetical protein